MLHFLLHIVWALFCGIHIACFLCMLFAFVVYLFAFYYYTLNASQAELSFSLFFYKIL